MKIEIRELVEGSSFLSDIFFECIPEEKLIQIRDKFCGDKDWQKESVKVPVELKIGGVSVNPKIFFTLLTEQIDNMVLEKAKIVTSKQIGSRKLSELAGRIYELEDIIKYFETNIKWEVENPFNENK